MPPTLIAVYQGTTDSGTATATAPNVQVGDWLVAGFIAGYQAATLTPAGTGAGTWLPVGAQVGTPDPNPAQENVGLAVHRKTATEAGTYTAATTATNELGVLLYHLRGCDQISGTPSVAAVGQGLADATVEMAATSPAVVDTLLIGFYGLVQFGGTQSWTPPAGMAERHDAGSPNNNVRLGSASQILAPVGSTGVRTATNTVATQVFGQAYALFSIAGVVDILRLAEPQQTAPRRRAANW